MVEPSLRDKDETSAMAERDESGRRRHFRRECVAVLGLTPSLRPLAIERVSPATAADPDQVRRGEDATSGIGNATTSSTQRTPLTVSAGKTIRR
jgi:hypothetical protein